jgi:hypothetical protein
MKCFVCRNVSASAEDDEGYLRVSCPECGEYLIGRASAIHLPLAEDTRHRLSLALRHSAEQGTVQKVAAESVNELINAHAIGALDK